jgi:deoxyadenosine/deoxycytidine kinase
MDVPSQPKKPLVVAVDGIVASGKSTIIRYFKKGLEARGLRVTIVTEPVAKWEKSGALKQFYEDPKRRAYQFQTRAFHDRVKESQKMFRRHAATTDVFLMERSIFTDVLFMKMLRQSGTVDETEFRDYMDLWSMWSKLMPLKPDLFIYLCPSVPEAMRRLRKRGRKGESGVTEEYQTHLMDTHDEFLGGETARISTKYDGRNSWEVPVLKLTTDENFVENLQVREGLTSLVYDRIQILSQ